MLETDSWLCPPHEVSLTTMQRSSGDDYRIMPWSYFIEETVNRINHPQAKPLGTKYVQDLKHSWSFNLF